MTGVELIVAERERQITKEGWSVEHDDRHTEGELRDAAICYAMACDPRAGGGDAAGFWPWEGIWWKPSDDPVRNLVKAGALIAAEIDRLQRAMQPPGHAVMSNKGEPMSNKGEPIAWVESGVRWSSLVEAVCDMAESAAVRDGEFSHYDADRLQAAAKLIRERAERWQLESDTRSSCQG